MALPAWLKWIVSTPKVIDTAADISKEIVTGVKSGLDLLVLTKEEKVQYTQKGAETLLKFWDNIAKENTEQSKARRDLAKMTFRVFFFFLLASASVYLWNKEYSVMLLKYADYIKWLVVLIAGIYFGPHQIQKIWSSKGDK